MFDGRNKYTISNKFKYDVGVITKLDKEDSKILLSDTNNSPEKNDEYNLPYLSLICHKFKKKNILMDNEQFVKIWKTHPKLRRNSFIFIEYTKPNGKTKKDKIEVSNIHLDKKNNTLGIKIKNNFIDTYEDYKPNNIYNVRLKLTNIPPSDKRETFTWSKYSSKLLEQTGPINKFLDGEGLCNSCRGGENTSNKKIRLNKEEERNIKKLISRKKIGKRSGKIKNRLKKLSRKNFKNRIDHIPLKVKNKSYLFKGPFLNPNRYNPFTDPQSIYFGGIYLCSHALAKLDFPFCKDSPVYAVPPPQGF